jgi:hypothetical protein
VGKQVTFVVRTKLFACNGKRGTGDASRQEVNATQFMRVEFSDVSLNDTPFWPVPAEGETRIEIDVYCRSVLEPSAFESKRLTAAAGAYFKDGSHVVFPPPSRGSLNVRTNLLMPVSIAHSRIVTTRHPDLRRRLALARSRAMFRSIFGSQYSRFDLGRRASLHTCPCQKQP